MNDTASSIVGFSETGNFFAHSSSDGCLRVWETSNSTLNQEYVPSSHLSAAATCLAWRKPRPTSVSAPVGDGEHATTSPSHRKRRSRAVASAAATVDKSNGAANGTPAAPAADASSSCSAADDLLALGTCAGSVLLYSVLSADLRVELSGQHTAAIRCLAWDDTGSSSGKSRSCQLFSAGDDCHVVQWTVKNTAKVKCKFRAGRWPIQSLCALPDGAGLLTAGRTITWWDVGTQTAVRQYTGHASSVFVLRHVVGGGQETTAGGVGGYFISAATGDRIISAWQLTRESRQQCASVSFALDAEPRDVQVCRTEDGCILLTAVTITGLMHVFRKQLNGVCKKPLKPGVTLQVATDGSPARPLSVLAARPDTRRYLLFCYGTLLRPRFENILYNEDEPSQCLVRTDPSCKTDSASVGGPDDPSAGRLRTPAADGQRVRMLAPGYMSVQPAAASRKRRISGGDAPDEPLQQPMEQRLSALTLKQPRVDGQTDTCPVQNTAGMANLLIQGLHGDDREMMMSVLRSSDDHVIASTVDALPPVALVPLFKKLSHLIRFADDGRVSLKWVRAVMERHTSFFLSQNNLASVVSPMYQSLQARVRHYPRLLELKGRLDLLAGQIAARQKATSSPSSAAAAAGADKQSAMLEYQDDSTDDETGGLGLPYSEDEYDDGDDDEEDVENCNGLLDNEAEETDGDPDDAEDMEDEVSEDDNDGSSDDAMTNGT